MLKIIANFFLGCNSFLEKITFGGIRTKILHSKLVHWTSKPHYSFTIIHIKAFFLFILPLIYIFACQYSACGPRVPQRQVWVSSFICWLCRSTQVRTFNSHEAACLVTEGPNPSLLKTGDNVAKRRGLRMRPLFPSVRIAIWVLTNWSDAFSKLWKGLQSRKH